MKKQIILTFISVLFFTLLGQSQILDENFNLKSDTKTLQNDSDQKVQHLTMPLDLNFKLNNNNLFYKGDSEARMVDFKANTDLKFTPKSLDSHSFYNPTLGYTKIIEKGKKVKGAKLSNAVSHGFNFWLNSN